MADQSQEGGERTYELLKQAGHSPAKAAEIALDAKRGDAFALQWVDVACAKAREAAAIARASGEA